jgi:hypothetical protein
MRCSVKRRDPNNKNNKLCIIVWRVLKKDLVDLIPFHSQKQPQIERQQGLLRVVKPGLMMVTKPVIDPMHLCCLQNDVNMDASMSESLPSATRPLH